MNMRLTLLFILMCLVVARFLVVPLSQRNEELREQITAKKVRAIKGEQILASEEDVVEGLEKIRNALSGVQSAYPKMKSIDDAKLQIQRRIMGLAREREVNVDSADWSYVASGNPVKATFELQFSGELYAVQQWMFDIEEIGPWISSEHIEYSVSNQNLRIKRNGEAKGTLGVGVVFIAEGS